MQHVQPYEWRLRQGWGMIEKCRRGFLAIHLLWEYDKSIFIHSILTSTGCSVFSGGRAVKTTDLFYLFEAFCQRNV